MKIGCSSWSFSKLIARKEMSLLDFINKGKELGLEAVELLDGTFPDSSPQYISKLSDAIAENNLDASVAISPGFCDATEEGRKAKVENVKRWTEIAHDIGAKIARITTGMQVENVPYTQQVHWVIDGFNECVELAEKYDVTYAIENHDTICRTAEGLLWIIDEVGSKRVQACPDSVNFSWETPADQMIYLETERLAPVAAHAHAKLCNFKENGESVDADYSRIIQILKDAEYSGCISMEIYGDAQETPAEAVTKGIALLTKYIRR